jgi:hypothetical protein
MTEVSAAALRGLADRFARGGPATPTPADVNVVRAPRWIEVAAEFGPYTVEIPGLSVGTGVVAGDASVDADSTLAAWAVVAGDGTAQVGWFQADRVNTTSAELEALRRAAATVASGVPVRVITDNARAARIAGLLAAGRPLRRLPRGVLHHNLAAAAKNELRCRPVKISLITAPPSLSKMSPRHQLLGPADRLAYLTHRLVLDGIPVTSHIRTWLGRVVTGHRYRHQLRKAYASSRARGFEIPGTRR